MLLAIEQHSLRSQTRCSWGSLDSDELWTGYPQEVQRSTADPPSWPRTHSSHHWCRLPKVFSLLHHCDNDDKDDVFLCAVLIRAVMMCHKESSLWAPHWKLDEPQSWSSEPFNHARTRRGSPLEGEQRKFTTNCFSHQLSQTPLPLNTDESCMPHAFFLLHLIYY